jgi:hypothetical protein
VERRLAQGPQPVVRPVRQPHDDAAALPVGSWLAVAIGSALVLAAFVVYSASDPLRFYDHFVWQADAFLHGRVAIDWPIPGNDHFQDVLPVEGPEGMPTGRALVPFPPLPAVLLLPFVAVWGLATDQQAVSVALGAIDVGLCWWMLGRLPITLPVRFASTAFFAFGTVFWYAAELGTTWYFAHVRDGSSSATASATTSCSWRCRWWPWESSGWEGCGGRWPCSSWPRLRSTPGAWPGERCSAGEGATPSRRYRTQCMTNARTGNDRRPCAGQSSRPGPPHAS